MCRKVNLIDLQKHVIIYKKKRTRTKKVLSILLFVAPFALMGTMKLTFDKTNVTSQLINNINPIYSPYVETSNIIFTSSYYDLEQKDLEFGLPVVFNSYKIYDNEISFNVANNNIVSAIEDGVVVEVSKSTDNIKYVKILHCDNYISQYENLNIVGVETGQKIKKSDKIGTVKSDSFKLKISNNNQKILIDKIENSIILCKK